MGPRQWPALLALCVLFALLSVAWTVGTVLALAARGY